MKKIIAIILAITMLLSFAGCKKDEPVVETTLPPTTPPETEPVIEQTEYIPSLDDIDIELPEWNGQYLTEDQYQALYDTLLQTYDWTHVNGFAIIEEGIDFEFTHIQKDGKTFTEYIEYYRDENMNQVEDYHYDRLVEGSSAQKHLKTRYEEYTSIQNGPQNRYDNDYMCLTDDTTQTTIGTTMEVKGKWYDLLHFSTVIGHEEPFVGGQETIYKATPIDNANEEISIQEMNGNCIVHLANGERIDNASFDAENCILKYNDTEVKVNIVYSVVNNYDNDTTGNTGGYDILLEGTLFVDRDTRRIEMYQAKDCEYIMRLLYDAELPDVNHLGANATVVEDAIESYSWLDDFYSYLLPTIVNSYRK